MKRAGGATQRRWRRWGAAARLLIALAVIGGVYTAFTPSSQAQDAATPSLSRAAQQGKALFDVSCVSCHGANAEGVTDRGPSLIGVGAAAVEFQVTTGRMPMSRQEAQAEEKKPLFSDDQASQLAEYIEEMGGGPKAPTGTLTGGDIANGGALFRVNCSSCHSFTAEGGALSSGKSAPPLTSVTNQQIYEAMLSGPQNMPVFGDNELTPQEKKDVIAYIDNLRHDQDPGGWGLGRLGPATETLAIFLFGMVGLLFVTLWIAGKS